MAKPLTVAQVTKEALQILDAELSGVVRYYKVKQLDGTWCISKGHAAGSIVKDKLTEAEANTYLRLLKEN